MNKKYPLVAVCLMLMGLMEAAFAVSPSVTNVQAFQQQNAGRKVEIDYILTDPDSSSVYITVSISTDNGATYTMTPTLITGDVGWVRPGGRRTIIWDAKTERPQEKWANCKAKVTADDSTGGVYPGEMIYIPAGSFLMGNNGHEPYSYSDELPPHPVYLSGYYIGKYEVTRGEYRKFMQAGGYSNSSYWSTAGWSWRASRTQPAYWDASQNWGTGTFTQTDNHPVVGACYYEAEAFCKWAGGRLPTEAEWEKAARWTGSHPNVYPWGDTWDAEKCNNWWDHNAAGGGYQRYQTAPVGSYPAGASPYGCQDMAGNVWEWCKDWYQSDYYSQTPTGGWNNPPGPAGGSQRALRGAGWDSLGGPGVGDGDDRCADRGSGDPGYYVDKYGGYGGGFRMAR